MTLVAGLERVAMRGLLVTGLGLSLAACEGSPPPADLAFFGGRIFTADSARPEAQAVAVREGRIVYVGSTEGLQPYLDERTEVVELEGRMLLPGFHDTHVHPVSGGIEAGECDLNAAESRGEVVAMVSACAERTPADRWIRGGGYQLPIFPGGAPSRELLDSIVGDRPAFLTSSDAHSAWVSSRALEIAGITRDTRPPAHDGVIVRTEAGEPQGTLRESAMELVERHLPPHTDPEVLAGLERGLAMAASFGITTVHEARASEAFVKAYATAADQSLLTARAIVALSVEPGRGTEQVAGLAELRRRYARRDVLPAAAKIFLDGVIEGGTAALLDPYLDAPGSRGELNVHPDTLRSLVAALDDEGFKVHVHAIGDRAIRVALDAFEAQYQRDGGAGPRHVMAHIQLFSPADVPRFQALGVVASFQPLWFYADAYITDLTEPRLGPQRSRYLYPARSVVETGAIVAAGSDWSVSSMNPLLGIEVAMTRRPPTAEAGPSWLPDERLDLETMLLSYTRNGALAGDLEEETGTITVGKSGDLVVLDRDLFDVPPEEISDAQVDLTVFRGRVVYRR